MEKNGKRVLGIFLLLIMLFTLVPSPNIFVMAEEEEGAAVESEAALEEQMVAIADEILSDLGENDGSETDAETIADGDSEEGISDEEASAEGQVTEEQEISEESGSPAEEPEVPAGEELIPYSAEVSGFMVSAKADRNAFDVPVRLVASVLSQNDTAYKDAEGALADSGKQYDGMIALDIHFEDENGNEVEPVGNVSVSIQVKKEVIKEAAEDTTQIVPETVEVNHITTDENGTAKAETVADFAQETEGTVSVTTKSEDVEQIDSDFTVDGFSTFTITWTNSETGASEKAYIHWGTMVDGSFNEFDSAKLDTTAASVSLANSFVSESGDEYYYLSAEYCAPGVAREAGVDILSILKKTESGSWIYTQEANTEDNTPETDLPLEDGSNIYAYYYIPEEPNPSSGDDTTIPAPTTTKHVESNGDGTYTITLDVQGTTVHEDDSHYANVLIILDATASMRGDKWTNAKAAMKALIETLTEGDNASNAGKIDFALVTFGRSATVVQNWTKDNAAFKTTCAGINMVSTSGTNWEAGMRGGLYGVLNNMPDSDPTYVIFLTDGDPNTYYWMNSDIGTTYGYGGWNYTVSADDVGATTIYTNDHMRLGYQGNSSTSATRSKDEAKAIAAKTKLYGIYCGSSGSTPSGESFNRLVDVIQGQGQGGQQTIAANADTIESTFQTIAETIVNDLGASNVSVDDGVPSLSNVSAAVSGEASGFVYQISTDGENYSAWAEAPGASYSNDNGVTWDLSSLGTVQPGTYYRLKFTVWPSQAAYDTIADLNNGVITMTDAELEAAGIAKPTTAGGSYTLKTNTHLKTTYTVGDETYTDSPSNVPQEAMILPTATIKVEKKWFNKLDLKQGDPVKLEVTRDTEPYLYGDKALTVSKETNWISDSIYISMGQIKGTGSNYEVIETGHDYEVVEPASFTYRWELTSEVYHPMVINGTPTMLIKDDSVTGTDGTDYYVINNKKYKVSSESDNLLTAVNNRRSWLQLEKKITGTNAPTDELFAFSITVTDPKGEDVWFSVYDPSLPDEQNPVKNITTSATAEVKDGSETGYYYASSGSSITVEIKAGWTLRFTNLRSDTTYTIEETTLPDGFRFDTAVGRAVSQATEEAHQDDPEVATITGMKASGKINVPNAEFYVDFTNEYVETEVEATKVWDDDDDRDRKRDDVTFNLLADGEVVTGKSQTISATATGEDLTVTWSNLPAYKDGKEIVYTVEEANVTAGKITLNGAQYTVTISGDAESGFEIKNSYEPEVVSVVARKVWVDVNDADQLRPKSVTVRLYADDIASGDPVTLSADNNWTYTWNSIPKNESGKAIIYTVKETTVPSGYTAEVSSDNDGFIITNTHAPKTTVEGTKTWVDGGKEHDNAAEITLTLKRQSTKSGSTVETLEATPTWTGNTYTFSDLDKYDAEDYEYTYTVEEAAITGYTTTVSTDGLSFTNTITQEEVEVTGTKTWVDGGKEHDNATEITLTLKRTSAKAGSTAETLKATPTWTGNTYKFSKLDKYDAEGYEYTYTVEEAAITGYTTTVSTDGLSFTNTITQVKISVEGTKTWVDGGKEHDNATEITLTLKRTSAKAGSTAETLKATPTWTENTYKFSELDKYDAEGYEYTYTVEEAEIYGYETAIEGFDITNTLILTEVSAIKNWKNADGSTTAPENASVVFTLVADGDLTDKIVTLSGETWKAEFKELPKYKAVDGEKVEIVYTVEETTAWPGYTSEVSKDEEGNISKDEDGNIVITNTQDTVDVIVNKVWEDDNDAHSLRPDSITINLLADGTAVKNKDGTNKTITLDGTADENGETAAWTATFSSLPKFKLVDGKAEPIEYTVSEDAVTGYVATIKLKSEEEAEETTEDTSETEEEDGPVEYTLTNTLINLEITKKVENLFDAGDTSNATFVFEITIGDKYHNYAAIIFDGKAGTDSTVLYGLPYEKEDTITVEEVYTAGHKLVSQTEVKWDEKDKIFKVSFVNTYNNTPGYGSGIINEYGHDEKGNPVVTNQSKQNTVS